MLALAARWRSIAIKRHQARPPGDEQQRAAVAGAPGEVHADRTAQLQLVADTKLPGQIRETSPSSMRSTINASFASSGVEAIEYERCV